MFFNFIGLTLFFGIGILVANGAKIVANKGKKSKGTILLMAMELLLLGIFLFVTLPSKNLSTVLWINLIGAVIASGVLLSTRLASKVEVLGIQKGRKEVGKNTNKTANKDWSGKILGVAVLAEPNHFIPKSIATSVLVLFGLIFSVITRQLQKRLERQKKHGKESSKTAAMRTIFLSAAVLSFLCAVGLFLLF